MKGWLDGPVGKDDHEEMTSSRIAESDFSASTLRITTSHSIGTSHQVDLVRVVQLNALVERYCKAVLEGTVLELKAAQVRPLQGWTTEIDAKPQRASRSLEAAIQLTTPRANKFTVRVSRASLSNPDEVEGYIEAPHTQLLSALISGNDAVGVKGKP